MVGVRGMLDLFYPFVKIVSFHLHVQHDRDQEGNPSSSCLLISTRRLGGVSLLIASFLFNAIGGTRLLFASVLSDARRKHLRTYKDTLFFSLFVRNTNRSSQMVDDNDEEGYPSSFPFFWRNEEACPLVLFSIQRMSFFLGELVRTYKVRSLFFFPFSC